MAHIVLVLVVGEPPPGLHFEDLTDSYHVLGGQEERQTIEILGALNAMYSDLFI